MTYMNRQALSALVCSQPWMGGHGRSRSANTALTNGDASYVHSCPTRKTLSDGPFRVNTVLARGNSVLLGP